MNVITWNCRGILSAPTVRSLRSQVRRYNPLFIFLAETKVSGSSCNEVARHCKYDGVFAVDTQGKSGGLSLFWKHQVQVSHHARGMLYWLGFRIARHHRPGKQKWEHYFWLQLHMAVLRHWSCHPILTDSLELSEMIPLLEIGKYKWEIISFKRVWLVFIYLYNLWS